MVLGAGDIGIGKQCRHSGSYVSIMLMKKQRKLGSRRMCTCGQRSRSERPGDNEAVQNGEV